MEVPWSCALRARRHEQAVRLETDPPGMGVVFKKLSKYSEKLIQKLLEKA